MSKVSEVFEKHFRKLKGSDFRDILKETNVKYLDFGEEMPIGGLIDD